MKIPELNPEEVYVGLLVGSAYVIILKLWIIIVALACGFLWAFGGAEGTSKGWRRVGVPLVLCIFCAIASMKWYPLLSIGPLIGVLSMGYGIPDGTDEGSWLGRLIYTTIGHFNDEESTNIVRAIIGVLIAIAMISLAWVSLFGWIIGSVLIIVGYPLIVKEL